LQKPIEGVYRQGVQQKNKGGGPYCFERKFFKFSATVSNRIVKKGEGLVVSRKEIVIGASALVLAVIAVVAIVFVWTNVDKRLAAIENKTWHTVGDFTLSPSKTSEGFHIQGEEWRLKFTFNEVDSGMRMGYNLRVYDANGYIVGGLSGIELADLTNSGKGILNIREGQGDYSVEIIDILYDFTFSFTVEEFY
jgi:hypothetical protein